MNTGRAFAVRGFTVIELMVTIAIAAILLGVAAPSFKQILANQRIRAVAYDLVADLVLARNEAIKRGGAGNGVTIAPAAGGWVQGWSVQVVSTSEVISQRSGAGGGVVFSSSSPASLTYDPTGRISGVSTTAKFGLTDGGSNNRCISIDPSGRPKTATTACP